MKSVIAGTVAAILIAVLSAVILSGFDMGSAQVFSSPNVRL
jgi:hypothetical protein